ncbi:MAG: FAD-binding oxidoreductase [Candidatus Nanoarchaeia archaeon]|nr:FAD-binding oxidoreductase [Candidatus Nanoarchaeia archaeon]MDD5357838.1 FAD-binding oxidoreductase [Candidatus Nanoarchaeia archaeon]MDD5588757.1 FAD-binding oxidoreductase [Candidatus Nanoarchaeia archaeon]
MPTHEEKVARIAGELKEYKSTEPVSLKKKSVSHQVPKPQNKKYSDRKIDISDLNEIISINPEEKICIAEPGVTFIELVSAALKHNLVPMTVPEHKTITIGGAVAGCSIESMSYKYGGFHDSCIEYEVITAKGDVIICSPEKDNLLFQMLHGTFGTLGIISRLKFKLIPAEKFVKMTYEKYSNLEDYKNAIWKHFENKDVDFIDGIIHSPTEYVLSVGNFVSSAPYTSSYDWTKIYFVSTKNRKEDYLKTVDYFFRYDKGLTSAHPKSFIGRLLLGKFMSSTRTLQVAEKFHQIIPDNKIPITIDLFIPFSRITKFMEWYQEDFNHFPLWCVPYRKMRDYEWISSSFLNSTKDELFLDIAIYGMKKKDGKNYYRILEEQLIKLGALKTLISNNFYSEEEFWTFWNKENYEEIKKRTDPDNIFRGLYEKTCKASMGLGR